MLKAIWDNIKGLYSLVVGLSITGRYLLSPVETIHYPRQVVDDEIMASFRGPLQLTAGKKDPAETRCVSCQMCVKACPGGCLTVAKGDSKSPVVWRYDFSYCCLCGACEETCPTGALEFSHKVYLVTRTRQELVLDLLADLKSRAAKAAAAYEAALADSAKAAGPALLESNPPEPAPLAKASESAAAAKIPEPVPAAKTPEPAAKAKTLEPAAKAKTLEPTAAAKAPESAPLADQAPPAEADKPNPPKKA
jgi:NADH-quinone oxidoreductase subunit I